MNDLRQALRTLRSTPLVSTAAILSLGLAIGATTAIFAITDSLILRPLPVAQPERLRLVGTSEDERYPWSNAVWEALRDRSTAFDGAFAWGTPQFNLATTGEAVYADGLYATGRFFEILGVRAALGRTFGEVDDRPGGGPDGPVAVISYRYWQQRYAGDADVLGRTISINDVPFRIIGVTERRFFGLLVGDQFDIALPLNAEPLVRGQTSLLQRPTRWLNIMVRLRAGQSPEATRAELRRRQAEIREVTRPATLSPQAAAQYLSAPFALYPGATGTSYLRAQYKDPLLVLMLVTALLLLIACGNVANLLLARATARRQELSVRTALGASWQRLARQLLTEGAVLGAAGALLGVLFAWWASRLLIGVLSTDVMLVTLDVSPGWRILGFTTIVAITVVLSCSVVPAIRGARAQPIDAMREQGRLPSAAGRSRFASSLVAAQVGVSLTLLVASALFIRSFRSLMNVDLGFDKDRVLTAYVSAQRSAASPAARADLYERARQAVLSVPGVVAAAASRITPVSGSEWPGMVEVATPPVPNAAERSVALNLVSPDWFAAYGTPLIAGRDFERSDRVGTPRVAIVNRLFMQTIFGGENPIGRRIRLVGEPDSLPPLEIVGVVGDAVYRYVRDPVPPTVYMPLAQQRALESGITLSVRTAGSATPGLRAAITDALAQVDPGLSVDYRALATRIDASLAPERVLALLASFFGGMAVLLAALGLYGVTSYFVRRQQIEIGIRMALGAPPVLVQRLVLRRVVVQLGAGLLAGSALSVWAARYAEGLLFNVTARDAAALIAAASIITLVCLLAGWLPARRAARVSPASIMRDR